MSGLDQLQYLSWLLYLLVFGLVLVRTIRRPTPAHLDMTLFFGAAALVIVATTLELKLHVGLPGWVLNDLVPALALALGYLLLRLVRDFSHVPRWLMAAVEIGMVVSIAAILVAPQPLDAFVTLALVGYLVVVIAYDAQAFIREAARTRGVTRRRMQAAAIASVCVCLTLLVAGLGAVMPRMMDFWDELGAVFGLVSGLCYFVGFAPPTWLRRAWQEPEVHAFLSRAVHLASASETPRIIQELERGAADAFGAPTARVALWNADSQRLEIVSDGDAELPSRLARPWTEQRATLIADVDQGHADHDTSLLRVYGARSALAAPITAYGKRIGVLVVFAPRLPLFANSDLELIRLLADQSAVILESKALVDQAAQVRAREEAARLKEDFLSSAAHDLKTPLTGIVTQAQVLQRRAERDPTAPADRVGIARLLEQSQRLKRLVLELLDVTRLEQGNFLGDLECVDLAALVRTLIDHESTRWRRVEVASDEPILVSVDPMRFGQVVTNLIENALKYSPLDTSVVVRMWCENGEALLSVHDEGIGVPVEDQHLVFERFHRGSNVDDRRFAGMGLGLYIARGIVEQHGGRIWVNSSAGRGSTFFVALPALSKQAALESQVVSEAAR